MATNISNLPISSSFQDLVLESGSLLQNATGSVINNLTITSSFAITASHATNVPDTASFAVRATSASMADSASYAVSASVEIVKEVSSSYADVAGVAQNVAGGDVNGAVASASFAETASFFDGSVVSSSFAESSSFATTASHALNVPATASFAVSASFATQAGTSRLADSASVAARATTLSADATASFADLASDARTATSASSAATASRINIAENNDNFAYGVLLGVKGDAELIRVPQVTKFKYNPLENNLTNLNDVIADTFTGSFQGNLAGTASFANNATSASHVVSASFANNASSASVATNANSASNADRAITASIADDIKQDINVVFNTGSFQLLTAQSASIGFLESITGSAKIIGDAFIILNNNLPAERFAGIKVIDTGSTDATASLIWDGNTNDWKYDFSASGDADSAVILFGPHADTITDTRYPENNYLLKGTGTHHLASSSIVDNASTVTIGNTTTFSNGASGSFSGSFEGELLVTASNALFATNALSASHAESSSVATIADTATTASHVVTASFADNASSASVAISSSYATSASVADLATTATSASFAESSSFAQDARTADSALTATTASHALSIPGVITNDIEFTGVVSGDVNTITIASNTASIDFDTSNFFLLTMPAGGNVHVNATNIKNGTTVNLQVTQNATAATMDFANYIKFESGSEYTVSTGSGNVDLISFVTFDATNLLGAGINHLV